MTSNPDQKEDPTAQWKDFQIIEDPKLGFRRVTPTPSSEQLEKFYGEVYYDLVRRGGKAPDIKRLMEGGDAARSELHWLRETLYTDIASVLADHVPQGRILDVGCGAGEFPDFLSSKGFRAEGIEPSQDAAARGRQLDRKVTCATLDSFSSEKKTPDFDAVTFIGVFESLPDPAAAMEQVLRLLRPGGVFFARVSNQFNALQLAGQKKLNVAPWWVSIPEHLNYFDAASARKFLGLFDFEVIDLLSDFPMEMFLLMGDDYVGNPAVGAECHRRRVQFEMSLDGTVRRQLYRAMAVAGIGRSCLIFARLKS